MPITNIRLQASKIAFLSERMFWTIFINFYPEIVFNLNPFWSDLNFALLAIRVIFLWKYRLKLIQNYTNPKVNFLKLYNSLYSNLILVSTQMPQMKSIFLWRFFVKGKKIVWNKFFNILVSWYHLKKNQTNTLPIFKIEGACLFKKISSSKHNFLSREQSR